MESVFNKCGFLTKMQHSSFQKQSQNIFIEKKTKGLATEKPSYHNVELSVLHYPVGKKITSVIMKEYKIPDQV